MLQDRRQGRARAPSLPICAAWPGSHGAAPQGAAGRLHPLLASAHALWAALHRAAAVALVPAARLARPIADGWRLLLLWHRQWPLCDLPGPGLLLGPACHG